MRTRVLLAALTLALYVPLTLGAERNAKPEEKPAARPASKLETELDPETKARLEEFETKMKELLATPEPVACYQLVGGDGMTVGLAVDLCSGTTNAVKTARCFEQAFDHPDNGGLGLPRGLAVKLCSTSPARE